MNNAFALHETLQDDSEKDSSPILRKRESDLLELIDALQHIAASSYWAVLQQHIFSVDLDKARKSIAKEKDTTELFRLQGEIRSLERFSLEKLIEKYRNELTAIHKQLHG